MSEVNAIARSLRLSPWACAFEVMRPWVLLAVSVAACTLRWWPLAPLLALGCFLASFTLLHDAMHRALGLPERANRAGDRRGGPGPLEVRPWAARAWTPVINSLAYHDLHHRCPRVPTALLPALADAVGPEVAFADVTIHETVDLQ